MTLHSVIGADQVQHSRVSRSGRIATDQKAVRRRGPGRVVLGSKPQLATAKELVRWAGEQAAACDYRKTRALGCPRDCQIVSYFCGAMRSRPPMYGRNAVGTATE